MRGKSPLRSLESLRQDYKDFMEKGHGNINRAKNFNNAIRPILLDIPLDMVKKIVGRSVETHLYWLSDMSSWSS